MWTQIPGMEAYLILGWGLSKEHSSPRLPLLLLLFSLTWPCNSGKKKSLLACVPVLLPSLCALCPWPLPSLSALCPWPLPSLSDLCPWPFLSMSALCPWTLPSLFLPSRIVLHCTNYPCLPHSLLLVCPIHWVTLLLGVQHKAAAEVFVNWFLPVKHGKLDHLLSLHSFPCPSFFFQLAVFLLLEYSEEPCEFPGYNWRFSSWVHSLLHDLPHPTSLSLLLLFFLDQYHFYTRYLCKCLSAIPLSSKCSLCEFCELPHATQGLPDSGTSTCTSSWSLLTGFPSLVF